MAFQPPLSQNLTEIQSRALSQYSALKNIIALPGRRFSHVPFNKQLTVFDYLIEMITVVAGVSLIDVLLKKYLDSVFNPNNDKLERVILKGIASHLDKKGQKIRSTISNEEWLILNVLPWMHEFFIVIKGLIVRQILTLIFGPKDKMGSNPNANLTTTQQNEYLNNSVNASLVFSVSNQQDLQTDGDVEFNLIKLKEQKEKGQVQFVISCQDVKVQLPPDFEPYSQSVILELQNAQSALQSGSQNNNIINPTLIFDHVTTHVTTETQRINSTENKNAVRKSFIRIITENMFNMLLITLSEHMAEIFNKISLKIVEDQGTNNDPLSHIIDENLAIAMLTDLVPTPTQLRDLSSSNDQTQFDQSSVFAKVVLNLLYATLLNIFFKTIFRELKKLIKNALAKKASEKLKRRAFKMNSIGQKINDAQKEVDRAIRVIEGLKEIQSILNPDQENFS
jgi:hypothetical protein